MLDVDFIVIIHRLYYKGKVKKGGLDQVLDYLIENDKRLLLFEYPLDYSQNQTLKITLCSKKENREIVEKKLKTKRSSINWLTEILFSLYYGYKFKGKAKTIITSDPLTALPAVLLRKAGVFKFHYYHSVDFSTDRFHNKLLNYIYIKLLVFGLKNADLGGVVTLQAKERLNKFNVKELFYIPNSPDYHSLDSTRKPENQRKKHSLVVTCSEVSHKYLVHKIVEQVLVLKQLYPDIMLNAVGNYEAEGTYYRELIHYINKNNLINNIVFYGNVERSVNYSIIAESYIGLAFYDGNFSHVSYGDSLKIREYCALGIPTIADKHTHTALEMASAGGGYVVDSVDEIAPLIKDLFNDDTLYTKCTMSAQKWAEANDKKVIMETLMTKFLT